MSKVRRAEVIHDPYQRCDHGRCAHDLCRGVLVVDLLDRDGPYEALSTTVVTWLGRRSKALPAKTARLNRSVIA